MGLTLKILIYNLPFTLKNRVWLILCQVGGRREGCLFVGGEGYNECTSFTLPYCFIFHM